jgi:hypothetical protein
MPSRLAKPRSFSKGKPSLGKPTGKLPPTPQATSKTGSCRSPFGIS